MDLSHVAVFVDALDASSLGPALSDWGPLREISHALSAGGRPDRIEGRAKRVRTIISVPFGVSVEEGQPGGPIRPAAGNAWHHVSFWSPGLPAGIARLEAQGYEQEMVGRGADGELATFAYMVSPGGPRIELGDLACRDRWMEGFRRGAQPAGMPGPGGAPPLAPLGVTAVADDLEDLRDRWQEALGIAWGPVRTRPVTISGRDGEGEAVLRTVTGSGQPWVAIVQSCPDTIFQPVPDHGWHHVSFSTRDLRSDVARLEGRGYATEVHGPPGDRRGEAGGFALLRAPEGMRIELVQGAA
jgi:hypothetical protein